MQNPTSTSSSSFPPHNQHGTHAQGHPYPAQTMVDRSHLQGEYYEQYNTQQVYSGNPDAIDIDMDQYDGVPDSQGEGADQGFMGDMMGGNYTSGTQYEGNEPYNPEDDRRDYHDHPQPHHSTYQGGEGYRGPTPDSEHGEGAVTVYRNQPQAYGRGGQGGEGRKEEIGINPYAIQGQGYPNVKDQERLSDLELAQKLLNSPTQHILPSNKPTTAGAIATPRAKGAFVPPQQVKAGETGSASKNEHVEVEQIGGRRVLTKRAGAKKSAYSEDEAEMMAERDEREEPEEFDPTAEIVKFDTKGVLVGEWEKIQAEMVPFLKTYCDEKLKDAFDEILHVCNLFYQLNEDARKDLEEGVKKIEEEEKKQEECRKVIVDFSKQMESVAAALSQFGGGAGGGAIEGAKVA